MQRRNVPVLIGYNSFMPEKNLVPVICSTARLARSLRMAHGHAQRDSGRTQWEPLPTITLAPWLNNVLSRALLAGQIAPEALPRQALNGLAEKLLWEQAIAGCLPANDESALFDIAGLAQSAAEANALMLEWQVDLSSQPHPFLSEETRQFLGWREAFRRLCREHEALEAPRFLQAQIHCLEEGAGDLPQHIYLAGYDRMSPLEQHLFDTLASRGVHIETWPLGLAQPAAAVQSVFDNAESECRAAVAWAKQHLTANPQAHIAIVAPELGSLRNRLAAILDDALHPETVHPGQAEAARRYDFSLGQPLPAQPLIATALALLRVATHRYRLSQQELGWLLRSPHWSAGTGEADARARLEARMRRKLGSMVRLEQLIRLARKAGLDGLRVSRLVQHLETLATEASAWPSRQPASTWARLYAELLSNIGWPGDRGLSSHEFQARQAWQEALQEFSGLDGLLGKLTAAEALRRFTHFCRQRIFQPESAAETPLLVMGMLEAASEPLDALWVMGMNDHLWPPPAHPNPLLPSSLQREAGAPNSCSAVQAEFAQAIHRRLLHSAPHITFSWAHKDGERELRPSPLLSGIPAQAAVVAPAATLAELLAVPAQMQYLDDHQAPPVQEGEQLRGGAALIRAQAICPAWAYYQYRLGARKLEEPMDGLDSMARGSLLHAVLQCFWNGPDGLKRSSADLQALGETALRQVITEAVDAGVRQFSHTLEEALPAQFLALEKLRLQSLLELWLPVEMQRSAFMVEECERQVQIEFGGIVANLVLDRVDLLEDGRLVVIDYKTGAHITHQSWAEERITEPQLPIYAALALSGNDVAAVCFAKVRVEDSRFVGVSAEPGILPGVDALEEARKRFPEEQFPNWGSLLDHWRLSLEALAAEIRSGEAAVRFTHEKDLDYCDVKPLLRLHERKLQLERS